MSTPTRETGFTVLGLEAQNVKRVRAIRIMPPAVGLVKVAGKNGQGKTSTLDCIMLALARVEQPTMPVRNGETKAKDIIKLADGQGKHALTVTRTWTGTASYLTVAGADGVQITRPREFLDKIVGIGLGFDPLEFVTSKQDDQVEALLRLLTLEEDPRQLDLERDRVHAERTVVNRDVKALKARVEAMSVHGTDVPDAEISIADLVVEKDRLAEIQRDNDAFRAAAETARGARDRARSDVERLRAELAVAETALEASEQAYVNAQTIADMKEDPDLLSLNLQIQNAETTNVKVREKQARAIAAEELRTKEAAADALTARIEAIDSRKSKLLAGATFPIAGLGFSIVSGKYAVTFNGIPLGQTSASEQMRIGMAIAMALNPAVRVVILRQGSLLDAEALAAVEQLAAAQGYQVWTEIVGEGDGSAFVIEDGGVKSVPETAK